MCRSALALLALFAGVATASRVKSQENPIRKIVRLMQDMSAEIETEKKKEEELFEKFMCICNEYPSELSESIAAATTAISGYTSKIEEETALKSKLAEELKTHAVDKDTAEKDLAKATTLREKEVDEYDSSVADLTGSIGQLASAIPALEAGASASALLQGDNTNHLKNIVEVSNVLTDFDKKQVLAFLSAGTDTSADSLDAASSAGSGEVLGILKQMKDDMEKNLEEAKNGEAVASAGFADLKGAKDQEIELAAESIEAKEKKTGELSVSIAQSQDALEDATEDKDDSTKMLNTLLKTCDSKKLEWQARLKSRTDEIAAISEAVTILNDDDALDVFKKAVPASLVEEPASGFLQTKHSEGSMLKFQKALDIIKQANKAHHDVHFSFLLSKMTTKLNSKQGPDFGAVSKMIDEMVAVLTNEQAEDSKKKEWCTTELAKAEKELATTQEKMDANTATISQIEDEMASLADDIKALSASIADLDKAVFEATADRKAAHAEYVESLSLTEAAVGLIGKAKNRLMKFYNPSVYKAPPKKEATMEEKIIASYGGFVQIHRHASTKRQMPDIPELPEKKASNSGGVVALMDTIVLDLEKDKATAEADEKNAQKEYVALMSESQTTREADSKSLVNKKAASAERESALVKAKEEKTVTFEELNNAHTFLADLHSSCDFVVQNFAMREEARTTELESLKSAKAVLAGASL